MDALVFEMCIQLLRHEIMRRVQLHDIQDFPPPHILYEIKSTCFVDRTERVA